MKKYIILLGIMFLLLSCVNRQNIHKTSKIKKFAPKTSGTFVTFFFDNTEKKYERIFISGMFCKWIPNLPKYALTDQDGDGIWEIKLHFPPGKHSYMFVADNRWLYDPNAPYLEHDEFSGKVSVIDVK